MVNEEIRRRVDEAFVGFEGNESAVYAIKRGLMVALAKSPVVLNRTYLLIGSRSTGKSELARRMTKVLDLPLVKMDGKAVRSREVLFAAIRNELMAHEKAPTSLGHKGGMEQVLFPAFKLFVDEVHMMSDTAQNGLLTALERDDRSVVVSGGAGQQMCLIPEAGVIFATTKPNRLDDAFRSRCAEIRLARYTVAQVARMVGGRFPQLPEVMCGKVAAASRVTPRVALDLALDLCEEMQVDAGGDVLSQWQRVLDGRGILSADGLTDGDVAYLRLLMRERKPVGERVIRAMLNEVEPEVIEDDIEPHLMRLGYVRMTEKGREITSFGLGVARGYEQVGLL